jgi:Phage protein Gp138 N-terminal domain
MATNSLIGTPSVAQRVQQQDLVFKQLAKRIASTMRCGLPGVITAFDPTTQYASVKLAITENLIRTMGGTQIKEIPVLQDVLVLFPGDSNWCLTFPSLVDCECYVCFADMCINAWATHGFKGSSGNWMAQDQEISRRHDLSDGFAILAPRSQPKAIQNYSTTAVELRSMDGATKIQMLPHMINVIGNLNVSTGASGTFTGAGGHVVTVQNGIIISIA